MPEPKQLTMEIEITSDVWEPYMALCLAQGHEPDAYLREICQNGLVYALDQMNCIDGGIAIDPQDANACYETALAAVADWLSAVQRIPWKAAREHATALLERKILDVD